MFLSLEQFELWFSYSVSWVVLFLMLASNVLLCRG